MCEFASFFHNPLNGDVAVKVLDSHGETEKALKLNLKVWREGHYLPSGEFELRYDNDRIDKTEYEETFKQRFPSFISFFTWALREVDGQTHYKGSLDLSGLTSAEGLVLPEEVSGSLDLRGLTSAEGLVLPTKIGGWLDLSGLTSAEGLVLPTKIGGWLDLRGLTSAEGLVLPEEIGGSLDLSEEVRKSLKFIS